MSSATSRRFKSIGSWLIVSGAVFLVGLVVLDRVNGSEGIGGSPSVAAKALEGGVSPALRSNTAAQVASLQGAVRQDPSNVEAYGLLGGAYYQRFRETADPSLIQRAKQAFDSALELDPANEAATVGLGTLALTRHDFHRGLRLGLEAHRLAPALVQPYNLIADAEVELGRYDAAARTLQRFVNLRPGLPSYSRISYFRELHGDIGGAIGAMRLAASAGGGGEPLAYVQTLLGRLQFDRGHYRAAALEYRRALEDDTTYTPALAGQARVDAARGSFASSIKRYRDVVERLPLPEYAISLAETELAAGRAVQRDLDLVRVEERLFRAAGVDVGSELALFEADHGQPKRAVRFGAQAWRRAPSVRSADAYSWALNSAGQTTKALKFSRRAMRLGSRDPSFLYHAGQIARSAGDRAGARELLGRLVAQSPDFNPLFGPRAGRALEAVR